ncbi:MAG: translation elongation factor Ts [Caldisericia bacterium]|nr:translation elongation factor Ts [Caldisericia bacterium]
MGLLENIKILRERTQAPMMDCKKALTESGNDVEKAVDVLREKGIAKASKKAGRETTEGRIGLAVTADKKKAVLVKLGCETDFVAKNEDFVKISENLSKLALEKGLGTGTDLLKADFDGATVEDYLKTSIGKVGENIQIAGVEVFNADKGIVDAYRHMGSKLVVVVEVASESDNTDKLIGLAHELAMQIAIDNPEYLHSSEIPKDIVDHERKVISESDDLAGKPDNVKERIIEGKVKAFFKTCCLLDLPYMRESKKLISEVVSDLEKELGKKVEVVKFKRISVSK